MRGANEASTGKVSRKYQGSVRASSERRAEGVKGQKRSAAVDLRCSNLVGLQFICQYNLYEVLAMQKSPAAFRLRVWQGGALESGV